MQSHFRLDVRTDGAATVIVLGGELDLASSPALEGELENVLQSNADTVILDLRELDFMDSTGLSVLVRAHQAAQEADRKLYLVRGPHQVQRLLTLTGLQERLPVLETPEEVLDGG